MTVCKNLSIWIIQFDYLSFKNIKRLTWLEAPMISEIYSNETFLFLELRSMTSFDTCFSSGLSKMSFFRDLTGGNPFASQVGQLVGKYVRDIDMQYVTVTLNTRRYGRTAYCHVKLLFTQAISVLNFVYCSFFAFWHIKTDWQFCVQWLHEAVFLS